MSFRSLAALFLVFAAVAAPWIAGANTSLPFKGWWLGILPSAAFALIASNRVKTGIPLAVRPPAFAAATILFGCLAWWTFTRSPTFATAFSEEHWRFLEAKVPFVMLHWPRSGHLCFLAGTVAAFLTSAELGTDENFRQKLLKTIALTGLAVAVYALGIRWLDWTKPPWMQISEDTEQFNVAFLHHNAPSACLNLAWPLLLWPPERRPTTSLKVIRLLAILAVVSFALPLWHSYTAPLIAFGILLMGFGWWLLAQKLEGTRRIVTAAIAALFLGIFVWQGWSVARLTADYPDGWVSASQTMRDAPMRDAKIKAAADLRGDRLVASDAPPRPAAWLTALRMAKDHPVIGLGPGSWVTHSALYSNDSRVNTFYQHRQFAHHDLLQTFAEWGGLGGVAWLVLWGGAFWLAPRRHPPQSLSEMGLVLSLLSIAVHSTVHFPLQNPALLLWSSLLLGLAWSPGPLRLRSTSHQPEDKEST